MATRKNKVNTESVKTKQQQERLTESHQAEHMSDAIEQVVFAVVGDRSGFIDLNRRVSTDRFGVTSITEGFSIPVNSRVNHEKAIDLVGTCIKRTREKIYRACYGEEMKIEAVVVSLDYYRALERYYFSECNRQYREEDKIVFFGFAVISSPQLKDEEMFCTLKV